MMYQGLILGYGQDKVIIFQYYSQRTHMNNVFVIKKRARIWLG